jgi:hypothetical protein
VYANQVAQRRRENREKMLEIRGGKRGRNCCGELGMLDGEVTKAPASACD